MKIINYAVCITVFILVQLGAISPSFAPFLSSPGNASILVFLDIHRSYHGDTCADADWSIFELAHSLHWKAEQDNLTGIEIYDTCSSQRRVYDIVRQRLAPESCLTEIYPSVSGVISHSSQPINDILTNSFDSVHVVIDDGVPVENDIAWTNGQMYVELASRINIEILAHFLQTLNWTYVTVLSDNHTQSRLEHDIFTLMADDLNICIQFSQIITDWVTDDIPPVKTDGVILFANDLSDLKSVIERLPKASAVAIATHDRRTSEFRFVHKGIVLFDSFGHNEEFSEYMTSSLWNQTTLSNLSIQYYLTNHNCSYINLSISNQISCAGSEEMRAYFNSFTSLRLMHVFHETLELVTKIAKEMMEKNCTNYQRSCFDTADVNKLSSYLKMGNNQTLVQKPPYNVTLTLLSGGNVQKADVFSTTTFTNISQDVHSWIDGASDSFPSSLCTTWCPSCQRSKCNSVSSKVEFQGGYFYVPGDILITGMLPFSRQWDKTSVGKICSGMRLDNYFDARSEAFLYALLSAHARYPDWLQNISIGALLFDTCSDSNRASQILLNFESCMYAFERTNNNWKPSPTIVPAYVVVGNDEAFMGETKAVDKLAVGVNDHGSIYRNDKIMFKSSAFNFEILMNFLHNMNLSYVGLVTSFASDNLNIQNLFETAKSSNVCIPYHGVIAADNSGLLDNIKKSTANVVIIFATSADVGTFFRSLTTRNIVRTWILIETRENWLDISAFPLFPLGSVIFSPQRKQNPLFNMHLDNLLDSKPLNVTTNNPWMDRYKQGKSKNDVTPETRMQASDVIKSVDISLEAISKAVESVCGNESNGLCPEFAETGGKEVLRALDDMWTIDTEGTNVLSTGNPDYQSYVIINIQEGGNVEVGSWVDHQLSLDQKKLRSYDSKNNPLSEFRKSYCFVYSKINITANESDTAQIRQLDYEMGYKNSSAKFKKDLWVLIVVIIAGTGSLMTILLMIYIMCKVCSGALVRRYLALGILLLIGMVFLFLSVLPFLFTPSENVCGMRYFAHGFSYAFCFGIILTKMMTLRDYRYIGLGGEISRINQMLTVFFITSVQVAIGVQWWVLRTPVVYSELILEAGEMDALQETTYYACDFVRKDFVSYHSYVIFLLVLCCFYSLSVRKETKNMKEARLLLICSWFCLALWIGIIVTIMVLDRKYLEAICAIGILGNALSMVVFIYLPKLTAISRLKYEVSEQNVHKENGYKLDTDFQFERPYSLPGTLHSSITDKALTYPRSLATFDTSLSY
ncbi:LOW QUALITY PROTEIN: uncharacterized protein LOC123528469 [Mercenaria mercenaria]|uniref:LOW QUALITY PROTEIN: uncharacterized protein LOC123528469 n=1 Tax=Mercenaria mercenaria TaxID=6596 RepID=UPI00234EE7E1|nr:LOW QUALITY PROTEIN: uncharacterized protein LOC123528469 [Mercenaria mercenaria]